MTMLSAAKSLADKCAGVVTFDPLMFPIHRELDTFKLLPSLKALLICTENFPRFLNKLGGKEANHDNFALITKFLGNNPKAQAKYLKGLSHHD